MRGLAIDSQVLAVAAKKKDFDRAVVQRVIV